MVLLRSCLSLKRYCTQWLLSPKSGIKIWRNFPPYFQTQVSHPSPRAFPLSRGEDWLRVQIAQWKIEGRVWFTPLTKLLPYFYWTQAAPTRCIRIEANDRKGVCRGGVISVRGANQRLTPWARGASTTRRPPGSMLAVTDCGSTASGRSNSRLNSRQLVRPGAFSSCLACTTSLRSTVFTVRSPGSNSAPISTAMRNTCQSVSQ